MSGIQIINPLNYPDWDDLLLTKDDCSFFHSSSWARVLSEAYGYKPLYFTSIDNGTLSALIPIMEIRSYLTGQRGVSLPFSDYCEPIVSNPSHFQEVIGELICYGKRAGWKYIEIRGGETYFPDSPPSSFFHGHNLDLTENHRGILSRFRSSTKRNIKKALEEGVEIRICNSLESIKVFYRLNCMTRRIHGLPPQPLLFFKKIYEHVFCQERGFMVLASYHKRDIAGGVFFHFGKKAIYKYGASERNYQHLRPNNLVMWEAIKWCAENGYRSFHFGRTEPGNKGLLQFKEGWGPDERPIKYYQYDLARDNYVKHRARAGTSWRILRKMPIPLLVLVGSLSYKHLG